MKLHTLIGCFACVLGLTTWSHAQAVPTATRSGSLQIGGGVTYARPDYGPKGIAGLTIYGDYDFTRHLGVEGDMHFVNLITPTDISEDTYLIGPRYRFHYNRFTPYAKALFGFGRFGYQAPSQYGNKASTYTYGLMSFGGGVDLRATKHLNVRAFDFEYQDWPGYRGKGLSPVVMTVGVAYSFR
ncbi:outer membrane beta-barrel protein [Edaphobacter paludis]|uniref:Outer membrane beta-barrel protein n=1 Tax=Edaphobacter paludis TaxID=3035702 RepID=A0AAU7D3H7_9BACT